MGFCSGDAISGTIDIEIGQAFDASDLVLEFAGVERSHLSAESVISVKDYHRENKEIVSIKQVVVEFPDGQTLQPGQYSYPFQVYTPGWLPESTLFKTRKDRFAVEYTIRAQFTPKDSALYVDHPTLPGKYSNVSVFRGSRRLYIYQPVRELQPKNYRLEIKSKVGLRLFGSTESICEIRFNRNQYCPGDMIDIWLNCDNSKCDKAVRSYKFKLCRRLRCREPVAGHFDGFETLIKTVKEPGCAAKKREEKHLQFQIPLMEKDSSEEVNQMVTRSSAASLNRDPR